MKQQGVALITALLIIALVVIVAISLLERQSLIMRRTTNHIQQEQAYLYILGVESWALKILHRDQQQHNIDYLGEMWAKQLPPTFISGGQLTVTLSDEQSKFNLNNLLDNESKLSLEHIQQFEKLLKQLKLPLNILAQTIDWIDPDSNPQIGGAEDNEYGLQKTPYRTGNTRFQSIEELRLLLSIKEEDFKLLSPHITALPSVTLINLNTTNEIILRSMVENISDFTAKELIEKAHKNGYQTVDDFLKESALGNLKVNMKNFGVASNYFCLQTTVAIGENNRVVESLLQRDGQNSHVLMRSFRGE